jgi:hypothetical protein
MVAYAGFTVLILQIEVVTQILVDRAFQESKMLLDFKEIAGGIRRCNRRAVLTHSVDLLTRDGVLLLE